MASPAARTIDRRDAAVTAALAGMVLVVLGYASGIGLRPAAETTATLPQPTPTPTPAVADPVLPSPAVAAPVAAVGAPMVMGPPPAAPTSAAITHPSATITPTPSVPTPSATPDPTCPPALLEGLVGDLPLVGEVSSLLSGVVGSLPLVGTTQTATDPGPQTGVLGCTVGAVLGPTCCQAAVARTGTAP